VTTSGKNENAEISKAVGPTIPVILGSSPQSSETMETDPLDPETCYDSDYERLNRSVDMDNVSVWSDMLDKQESELHRLFSRSSFPVSVGNFVQVLRSHLKFKFMTPNRVNLIVKTCVRLKIQPEDFKQTVRGVRSELTPTSHPKLRAKLSTILLSWPN